MRHDLSGEVRLTWIGRAVGTLSDIVVIQMHRISLAPEGSPMRRPALDE